MKSDVRQFCPRKINILVGPTSSLYKALNVIVSSGYAKLLTNETHQLLGRSRPSSRPPVRQSKQQRFLQDTKSLQVMNLLPSCVNTKVSCPPRKAMVKFVMIALILFLVVPGVCPACGRAEYLIGEECCPMCGPGYHVGRHCTEFITTTCAPCLPSTFTDAPNGLESCRSCRICDSTAGLKVKTACSSTSDTLCEPLEGYYCTDPIKDDCRGAVEHTKCSPGQYIKQKGTSFSDSICAHCVSDTYSDGSFTSCRPHTWCDEMGLKVIRKGSTFCDTECAESQNTVGIIIGVIVCVILVAVLFGGIYLFVRKKKKPTQRVFTVI